VFQAGILSTRYSSGAWNFFGGMIEKVEENY